MQNNLNFQVSELDNNSRLDKFISKSCPQFSRSFIQNIIDEGLIIVNDKVQTKPSYNLKYGYKIVINLPQELTKQEKENLIKASGIELIFEHQDFLIVYKPAGILTHLNTETHIHLKITVSIVDWLKLNYPEIMHVGLAGRPGIVHRLDFLTSGLLLIARNQKSFDTFIQMFKDRKINKIYLAIVEGNPEMQGEIDFPIVQKPGTLKMKCVKKNNFIRDQKEAKTLYKVLEQFKNYALVSVDLITGRTHQIRVHFACIGHPVLGDDLYGKKSDLINRQALHAYSLEFDYEGNHFKFIKDLPEDMKELI